MAKTPSDQADRALVIIDSRYALTEDLRFNDSTVKGRDRTMRRVITTAVLGLSVAMSACSGPKVQEFGAADAQAIRQAATTLETAFNARETEKILALYTDNSVFMPPHKPLLRGRGPLTGFYDGLFAAGSKDLKMTVDDVAGHGPIAYASGSYSMMNGPTHDRGKFLFVLRQLGGTWKFEYTSWNSDLPPAAQ